MFAILLDLSMDYEVFLLTRVCGAASGPQYVSSKGAVHAMVKWLARTV